MRINGLIQTSEHFHELFSTLVKKAGTPDVLTFKNQEVEAIHQELLDSICRIESLCKKHQATPGDLPNPSFRAYQWFKFLGQKKWLLSHLHALYEFSTLSSQLIKSKKLIAPKLEIRIAHSSYLFRVNQNHGQINFELSEGFITAPQEMKEKILQAALNRKNRQHAKAIRAYTRSSEYQQITSALNSASLINQRSYKGEFFNLKAVFEEINREYFSGKLDQPRLMWSTRRSKRRLGYYDPHSNTITINRRFDTADTPHLLVEYILFHEMLHQHMGIREVNGRRYAHTGEFNRAEKRFKQYEAAEKLVKQVNL